MKSEKISQYKSKLVILIFLAATIGFVFGVLKSLAFIISNQYLQHKMYYLTLYWFTSIIGKCLLIGLVIAVLALIVLIVVEAFLESVGANAKLCSVILRGVVPAFLVFIGVGYWLNKIYLPGFFELKSIIGNAIWVVACVIMGWLILRMSQTKFVSYVRTYNLRIIVTIICLVVAFNGARYLYFLSLESGRSNLILISIDTLRADHLGCYGYNRNTSPNVDRFSEDGVLFANTIAQSSWTLPSHMALLTGLYPTGHGVLSKYTKLSNEQLTIGEILQNAGYETAAITDGVYLSHKYGYQGFDLYDDKANITSPNGIERTYARAVTWLSKSRSRPFFLFLHTYQVHAPYDPSLDYDIYSDKNYRGIAKGYVKYASYHRIQDELKLGDYLYLIDKYDGEIYYTDHFLGKLFEELKHLGLYDTSVIVITSDHGENFLDHKAYNIGHSQLYDEVVKVPLIIKAHDFPRNQIINGQVESIDIMPTVLELLAISIPIKVDGVSLVELVKNRSYDSEFAFSEVNYDYKMIRSKDWKLLHRSQSELELFDLINDPDEQHNLFDEKAQIAKPLFDALTIWIDSQKEKSRVSPTDNKIQLDKELTDQLKALGYIN